jgi:hypothetical protein
MILIALLSAPLLMGVSCADGDKYRTGKNLLGVVKLGPFPKQSAGVGGYNLYIAKAKEGPFEKINEVPVLGLTSLMVPQLNPGQNYYFRMTSVGVKDPSKESAPGAVFARVAKTEDDLAADAAKR